MSTPPEMAIGAAQAATVFDGTNYIILTANWRGGIGVSSSKRFNPSCRRSTLAR